MLVPDRGGMVDQTRDGVGWTYISGDGRAMADELRAILAEDRLPRARETALRHAGSVRTMDAHFRSLFERYETIARHRTPA